MTMLYRVAFWSAAFAVMLVVFAVAAFSQVVPVEVKQAAAKVVAASNIDGIHEEAFKWGKDAQGNILISYSVPGKPCDNFSCHEDFTPADPAIDNRFVSIDGFAHVHPRGDAKHAPVQPPSKEDLAFAAGIPGTVNIVIGAGNKIVYFFDGHGVTGTMKLKELGL